MQASSEGGRRGRARQRRRRAGGEDWCTGSSQDAAHAPWTEADDARAQMLVEMGFGENASRRAVLHVGALPHASQRSPEEMLEEAITWLTSQPPGVDDPLELPSHSAAQPPPMPPLQATEAKSKPAPAKAATPKAVRNRWTALLEGSDDSDDAQDSS